MHFIDFSKTLLKILKKLVLHVFLLPVTFYQYFISPLLPPSCRFYPSCSSYAKEAFKTHGVLIGGLLALKRLSRCHPWGGSGIDPVPEIKSCCSHALKQENQ